MAVLGINEDTSIVRYSLRNGTNRTFDSDDFTKNWYDAAFSILSEIPEGEHMMLSSSVDYFISESKTHKVMYLTEISGKWELTNDYIENGLMFFVEVDTEPTWAELKAKYKK